MRVVASRVIRVGGAVAGGVGTVRAPLDRREGLVLVLTSDSGLEGIGEASPLPRYSPDTIDEAADALDGIHASLNPIYPERAKRVEGLTVENLSAPAAPLLENVPSARFAVETALLDLLGQESRIPIHRLFPDALAMPIPRSALLPPPCDARTITAARDAIARGIRTLKLKLGAGAFEEELAALVRLRAEIGDSIELRLDANGGLGEQAADRLAALAAVRPAFVEEPLSGRALLAALPAGRAALNQVRGGKAAPNQVGAANLIEGRFPGEVAIAADESLADPRIAEALLAHPGLGAIVVKPALLGFLRAREIAVAASRRGLPVVVTHMFDGPIALAACAELALSLPSAPAACGIDRHPALAAFPPRAIPQLDDPAFVVPADGSGLCLSLPAEEVLAWRT